MTTHDYSNEQLVRIRRLLDDARHTRALVVHPTPDMIRQLVGSLDAMLKELRGFQIAATPLECVSPAQAQAQAA